MVVDDEYESTLLLKILLEHNGFIVDSFDDPFLAMENFQSHLFSLIILNIKIPKLNGFQLYREIRKIDKKVKLCFITASEKYYEPFRKEIYDILGENCFIQKPIANDDLLKLVNIMINR